MPVVKEQLKILQIEMQINQHIHVLVSQIFIETDCFWFAKFNSSQLWKYLTAIFRSKTESLVSDNFCRR